MKPKAIERTAAAVSLLVLVLAWAFGETRVQDTAARRIRNISGEIKEITRIDENLYRGYKGNDPKAPIHIAIESRPGYGGPLSVAMTANEKGIIEQVAVLHSTDTRTYLAKVVGEGILDAFPGRPLTDLPHVDTVSGATISSRAILEGIERAGARMGNARFNMTAPETAPPSFGKELPRLAVVVLLFLCAFFIAGKGFGRFSKQARAVLMLVSTLTLGVLYGTQFSLSSLTLLIGGGWTKGIASHGALLCLVLAILLFLFTRKNLYCASLCPFGAVQEGLGRITGCSPPKRSRWMTWTARITALSAVSLALYFKNPSDAVYEPFGMAFNFIGSDLLFAMTVLIIIASLLVKRPWCTLFCPVTGFFDYLRFLRNGWTDFIKKRKGAKEAR